MTSRLIGLGFSDSLSNYVSAKDESCRSWGHIGRQVTDCSAMMTSFSNITSRHLPSELKNVICIKLIREESN